MLIRVVHQVTSSISSGLKEAQNSRLPTIPSETNLGKLPEMASHSMQQRMPRDPNDKNMYIDSQPVASLLAASTEEMGESDAGKTNVIVRYPVS